MKTFFSLISALLLAVLALAAEQPQKQIIVSYPKDTPAAVLEEAKKAVLEAGGFITHEYHLIMGFAASAPAKILDTIQAAGSDHHVIIEQDREVSINTS
ncbi:Putative peptidase S8 propeptide/proteinase inhibitor I9 superfamily [Septoria linicola]|uniref:Peptidase S8 propeptide/proteinase inhibitor I9 superfamily n=1 Tax=Septoria linicola TaxID=215465 RepID=A0A9Q9EF85_9PEZI|nr:putative peptidase S8 propeptide/proteinase inhibitor I9 superfamily [Septoria linicola]USW49531.1 Putative peptidase S8 propeptide/proteinase inhibitor I9 superfamily [Septoria linicola]